MSNNSAESLTFASQAPVWMASLCARRKPVAPATLYVWQSVLNSRILPVLGSTEIATFENGAMKQFIDRLCADGLSPRSVRDIVLVVKNVIASAIDANGNFLYPRVWNHRFLNAPPVQQSEMPCPDAATVAKAVQTAPARWSRLIAVLASTGLRIGELASLRTFDDGKHSCWNGKDVLHVRTSIWNGQDVATKTTSGVREIYMCSALVKIVAEQAKNRTGFLFGHDPLRPIARVSAARALKRFGIYGFHSLRRFRTTTLRVAGCPEEIIRAEVGHSGTSITDLYSKVAKLTSLRREWSDKVGLGFHLDFPRPIGTTNQPKTEAT
jgi:integrase